MKASGQSIHVGILGGGQLARMLAEAAFRLGLSPVVLTGSKEDPAAQLCPNVILGTLTSRAAIRKLLRQVAFVAFENEFVDTKLLERAASGTKAEFCPGLETIRTLQDKLGQKRALYQSSIPTARFLEQDKGVKPIEWLRRAREEFGGRCVLKWARLGYDGKGIYFLERDEKSLKGALSFLKEAKKMKVGVFAERRIDFKRELAMVATYSANGDFIAYPLVVSEQSQGICRRVLGPATALGVSKSLEVQAQLYARRLGEGVGLHGSFALEFFETHGGELLVNEIAPRVHNTGHYTQDACETSQFENHWRAILGMPLGEARAATGFAMLNVLGPDFEVKGAKKMRPLPPVTHRTHRHWYGKTEIRPGRKLGHLNGVADSALQIEELAAEMERSLEVWHRDLKKSGKQNGKKKAKTKKS